MRPERIDDFDALLRRARRAEPPALGELEMRRLSVAALKVAEERSPAHPRAHRTRNQAWLAVSALALVALGTFFAVIRSPGGTAIEVGRAEPALRFALLSGDTVIAAPGALLRISAQEVLERRIHMQRGTALFDVVPLLAGQLFEVETRDARIRVLGTVFSVEVESGRTVVRVYEGRVYVAGRTLQRGEVWVSSGPLPASSRVGALATEGEHHAFLRGLASPRAPDAQFPAVLPLPRSAPLLTPGGERVGALGDAPSTARVFAQATNLLYSIGDAQGALSLLDVYDLDAENGIFRERASVLRVDALLRLGRTAQAAEVARRYVLREPVTHTSARMRAIAAGLATPITGRE